MGQPRSSSCLLFVVAWQGYRTYRTKAGGQVNLRICFKRLVLKCRQTALAEEVSVFGSLGQEETDLWAAILVRTELSPDIEKLHQLLYPAVAVLAARKPFNAPLAMQCCAAAPAASPGKHGLEAHNIDGY